MPVGLDLGNQGVVEGKGEEWPLGQVDAPPEPADGL